MASKLFSDADLKAIEGTVSEVEAHTAGELVVVILNRCDDHARQRAVAAALASMALTYVAHMVLVLPHFIDLWVASALMLLGYWVTGFSPLLRALVPLETRKATCGAKAFQYFAQRGVYRTRDRSGLLLLIAEAEHEVVILADEGVHARVQNEGWQGHVDAIVDSVRAGRPCDGVVAEIRRIGEVLAENFPPRESDIDELPNAPVVA